MAVSRWQDIPNAVLDDERRADEAAAWAARQYRDLAKLWAADQRSQLAEMVKSYGYDWQPPPPAPAETPAPPGVPWTSAPTAREQRRPWDPAFRDVKGTLNAVGEDVHSEYAVPPEDAVANAMKKAGLRLPRKPDDPAFRDVYGMFNAVMDEVRDQKRLIPLLGGMAPHDPNFDPTLIPDAAVGATAARRIARGPADEFIKGVKRVSAAAGDVGKAAGRIADDIDELGFYSHLRRVLAEKVPDRATPEQILATLRNNGVKPDEMKWTGLDDWLATQRAPVRKADVLDYVDQNRVSVEEVVKGSKTLPPADQARLDELLDRGGGWTRDEWAEWERLNNARKGLEPTRYESYQLPGGQNYRELLLTLPDRPGRAYDDFISRIAQERGLRPVHPRMLSFGIQHPLNPAAGDRDQVVFIRPADQARLDELLGRGRLGRDGMTRDEWAEWERLQNARVGLPELVSQLSPDERAEFLRLQEAWARSPEPYQSRHWGEPNVLAHVRFNDRTDADGKRVLFIEEVQSDWHQAGREKGYRRPGALIDGHNYDYWSREANRLHHHAPEFGPSDQQEAYLRAVANRDQLRGSMDAVPDAPFSKTWPELTMKRVIRWASENGYDRVAWTRGEQQAERYDLSTRVDELRLRRGPDGTFGYTAIRNNEAVDHADRLSHDQLAQEVGREFANRIATSDQTRINLSGLDLRLGGEGMRGFYDEILPEVIGKIGKRFGARVREIALDFGGFRVRKDSYDAETQGDIEGAIVLLQRSALTDVDRARLQRFIDEQTAVLARPYRLERADSPTIISRHATAEAAWAEAERLGTTTVRAIDITPQMRESVMGQGQPLFAVVGGVGFERDDEGNIEPTFDPVRGAVGVAAGTLFSRRKKAVAALPPGAKPIKLSEAEEVARLRLDKFDPDIAELLKATAADNDYWRTQRRGVIPDAEAEKMADQIGKTFDEWIAGGRAGRAYNNEETRALRNAYQAQALKVNEFAAEVVTRQAKGETTDMLLAKTLAEGDMLAELQRVAEGARAEAGRGMRAWQAFGRSVAATPADAIKRIFDKVGGRDNATKVVLEYQKLVQQGADAYQMADFWARVEKPPTFEDWFQALRYNSMLSGPRTFEVNFIGNMAEIPWRLLRDVPASLARGRPEELSAEMAGLWVGMQKGIKGAMQTVRHGITAEQAARGDVPKSLAARTTGPSRVVATGLEVFSRGLGAMDEFGRQTAYGMALGRFAGITASKEGLRREQWAARVAELMARPTDAIMQQALDVAERMVFKGEMGPLGKALEGLQGVPFLGRIMLPFLRTVYHITNRGIDRSPLGAARLGFDLARGAYKGGKVPAGMAPVGERVGDAVLGTAAFAGLYAWAMAGNLSAAGPDDPRQRELLRAQGWQPYAIRVGNSWVSYANWGPVAVPFSLAASAVEAQRYAKRGVSSEAIVENALSRSLGVLTEQTYLQFVGDVYGLMSGRPDQARTTITGLAQTLIPAGSLLNTVGQAFDPVNRAPERGSIAQAIQARIPVARQGLPEQQDVLGRPVENPFGGARALLPIRATRERFDPALAELTAHRVGIGAPPQLIDGRVLSADEQRSWRRIAGPIIEREVGQTINRGMYQSADPARREKLLRQAIERARELAKKELLRQIPAGNISQRRGA